MPSGKSLELAKIQPPPPDVLCAVCRRKMSTHYSKKKDKKGRVQLLKKYEGHYPTGSRPSYRAWRPKKGWKQKSMAHRKKTPSSFYLSVMKEKAVAKAKEQMDG